jgi:hypothetical protein
MISKSMLFTTFLSRPTNTAGCVSHTEPVAMNWNDLPGIGGYQTFRLRLVADGSSVPISLGRLPDKIDR